MTTILTWIKPTSDQLHIWNYFGAVKPMIELLKEHQWSEIFFMIASLHALTTFHDAKQLHSNIHNLAKLYIAMMRHAGLDESKICIFDQADVPAHGRAQWIVSCLTHMWFMERMHAYKDASAKWKAGQTSVGTFNYPILMAVDILLYNTTHVPVGKDQKQHLEFARDIAQKINSNLWEVFVVPEPIVREAVASVPGLDGQKMSKSYNNFIGLLENEKTIRKKVSRIPTDAIWVNEPKDPDQDNVYALRKLFLTPEQNIEVRNRYTQWGLSYKDAKQELWDAILELTQWIQAHYKTVTDAEIGIMLKKNWAYATKISNETYYKLHAAAWFSRYDQ